MKKIRKSWKIKTTICVIIIKKKFKKIKNIIKHKIYIYNEKMKKKIRIRKQNVGIWVVNKIRKINIKIYVKKKNIIKQIKIIRKNTIKQNIVYLKNAIKTNTIIKNLKKIVRICVITGCALIVIFVISNFYYFMMKNGIDPVMMKNDIGLNSPYVPYRSNRAKYKTIEEIGVKNFYLYWEILVNPYTNVEYDIDSLLRWIWNGNYLQEKEEHIKFLNLNIKNLDLKILFSEWWSNWYENRKFSPENSALLEWRGYDSPWKLRNLILTTINKFEILLSTKSAEERILWIELLKTKFNYTDYMEASYIYSHNKSLIIKIINEIMPNIELTKENLDIVTNKLKVLEDVYLIRQSNRLTNITFIEMDILLDIISNNKIYTTILTDMEKFVNINKTISLLKDEAFEKGQLFFYIEIYYNFYKVHFNVNQFLDILIFYSDYVKLKEKEGLPYRSFVELTKEIYDNNESLIDFLRRDESLMEFLSKKHKK